MDIASVYKVLDSMPGRSIKLHPKQKEIIEFGQGPLWIIAGPGSGKTEVLVLRCLKLLCVDKLHPKSIIITTFTEKAARNIEDRIASYMEHLVQFDEELRDIDTSLLRVGTLHSLCNEIMQEYRYEGYREYRLLDDIEEPLFIYANSMLTKNDKSKSKERLLFWHHFAYLVDSYSDLSIRPPGKWKRVKAANTLFDRIVDDMIDVEKLKSAGGPYATLAEAFEDYVVTLDKHYRCDFSHLQQKFLNFLGTERGKLFVEGNDSNDHPGVKYVLVDEYQDTNPIQEAIYLKLARPEPHNLCVVGDDDQALYRFRGGTVECMVNFDKACHDAWDTPPQSIVQKPLSTNYRSHEKIVKWCSAYIQSLPVMNRPGARVKGKPQLEAGAGNKGDYPAVACLYGKDRKEVAIKYAQAVRELLDHNILKAPEQCVLLLPSVKEGPRNAKHFVDALREEGLNPYNPRSGALLEQQEIKAALGAFVSVLDPDSEVQRDIKDVKINDLADSCRAEYGRIAADHDKLRTYVTESCAAIKQIEPGKYLSSSLFDVFYHILNYNPFAEWLDNPLEIERALRLGIMTQVLERYSSTPYRGKAGSNRRGIRTSTRDEYEGRLSVVQLSEVYYMLFGSLLSGRLDEPEDDEFVCPPGRVPLMTIHQVKGLEFPFVFVGNIGENPKTEFRQRSVQLEEELNKFKIRPSVYNATVEERAEQDMVRAYFVAYSRAQRALILLPFSKQLSDSNEPPGVGSIDTFNDLVEMII